MSNESTNIIETMSAELEHLRPMEASLEMAEADVKAYKQRIAVLEKEVERLQRYHDAEAIKWLAENQKLKDDVDKVIAEKDTKIIQLEALIENYNRISGEIIDNANHHKFKQCLAMAKWCDERIARIEKDYAFWRHGKDYAQNFYKKWRKRWRELAEKFKEARR